MARERSIVIRLRAEVSDFKNQISNASRSLSDFEREQQKLGGAADTTLGRLAQSAKINEREWQNVGRTLAVTGGAVTGLGVAALKTGIEYNSLRQNATKALESVTGSTQGAAEQMQRLDEYGQQSWLMRDVLIRAQQQMSGFGIETEKVIPYMDALAEAVAGTTGSQENFEELARVMGTIESQGKITARELNQFGIRGIDAAELIGNAMGKTADQIRDEITSGTLDASEALDALAQGMDDKFAGSSDRLRDTFQGAVDNVMGAWRDLGAELAKPLVNPEGGGLLVDFMNGLADALNRFKDSPGWLKGTVVGISGLVGVTALVGGAFMLAIPKINEFRTSIQTLSNAHPLVGKFSTALGKLSKAVAIGSVVAVTAGAFVKLADALSDSGIPANADRITAALAEVNGMDIDTLFLEATAGAYDLNGAMEHLADLPFGHEWGMDVAETLGITSNSALNAKNTFEELDSMLAGMVQGGDTDKAAELFELLYSNVDQTKFSVEDLEEKFPGYMDALAGAAGESEITANATEEMALSMANVGSSAEEAEDAMDSWIALVQEAGGSFGGILDAFDAVMEKNEDLTLSNSQTMEQWIEEMKQQREAVENWSDNIGTAMDQIRSDVDEKSQGAHLAFVREMMAAGEGGAEALQTFVDGTPEQRQQLVDEWLGTGEAINEATQMGLEPINVEADTEPAFSSFSDFVDKVNEATTLTWLGADSTPAKEEFGATASRWESTKTDTKVGADTSDATGTTSRFFSDVANTTTPTGVDADTAPAVGTTTGFFNRLMSTTTDTNVEANTVPAVGTTGQLFSNWANTTTNTNLDANDTPARSIYNSLTSGWASDTTTTTISADTSPARSAWSTFKSSIGNLTTSISAVFTGGKYEGGFINPGLHSGGEVQPGLKAGGWVPGERAGYDNVLWPLHSGGQVLNQPLEGREFVVNSRDAARYPQELAAMNNGTYPTGMLERAHSPAAQFDYQKLASALQGHRGGNTYNVTQYGSQATPGHMVDALVRHDREGQGV